MERETKRRREKKKKRFTAVIAIVVVIALVSLTAGGIYVVRDISGANGENKSYVVEIPSGAGTASVSKILQNRGIISSATAFQTYVKLKGEPAYQKGRHTVNPSMGYNEIIQKLTSAPDVDDVSTKRIVIPEGYELRQIADLLEEKNLIDRQKFMDEVNNGAFGYDFVKKIPRKENRLEGYLYPDTYLISAEETEHDIIEKMLKVFSEKAVPVYKESKTPFSLDQVVILASIVEREAANTDEMKTVASVFLNRLDRGKRLESCATVQYILKERKKVLSVEDTKIESPYNTYQHSGLPVGPIASPSLTAIKAVVEPEETEYLYFKATEDGSKSLFSKTFEEHNQK